MKLIFGSISNLSFAGNTDSKNQIRPNPRLSSDRTDQQRHRSRKKKVCFKIKIKMN